MQLERHFETTSKTSSLRQETKKAMEKFSKPPKKPRPKDEIEKILFKSPDFGTLTPEELTKDKEIIKTEMAEIDEELKREKETGPDKTKQN